MPAATDPELLCLSFWLSPTTPALLPAHECLEVLPLTMNQVVGIPDMPPAVMGVANWRGEVLWLLDLACWLGFGSLLELCPQEMNYNALIITHNQQRLGLVVTQVGQMFQCPLAQLQSPPGTEMTRTLAECLRGYWVQEQVFLVLDGRGIIQSLAGD